MAMKVRLLLSAVLLISTMWLAGCGHYNCGTTFGASTCTPSGGGISSGNGSGSTDAFLFIADAGGIQGETLDATKGTISNTTGSVQTVAGNIPGQWMAIAQKQYMYVAYPSTGSLYGWTIAANGSTSDMGASYYPYGVPYLIGSVLGGSQAMIANPAGTLLFMLDPSGHSVYVYQIGAAGALSPVGSSAVSLPFEPYNLAIDGLGKYLYVSKVSGTGTDQIAAYSIGSSGTLTAVAGSPFTSPSGTLEFSAQQLQGESTGKYMIGTTASVFFNDDHIYVYSINQTTGALAPVGSPIITTYSPASVTVQPSQGGNLVYSFSFDNTGLANPVEGFTLDLSSGNLTTISGSPFQVDGSYGQFDQSGTYLFVVGTNVNTAYNVTSATNLTKVTATVGWGGGAWMPTDVP